MHLYKRIYSVEFHLIALTKISFQQTAVIVQIPYCIFIKKFLLKIFRCDNNDDIFPRIVEAKKKVAKKKLQKGRNQNETPSKDTQRSLWYSKFNVAKHKTRVLNIHDGETESGKGSRCVIPNAFLLSRARNLIDIELFFFVHDLERVTVVRLPIRRRTGFPEGPSHLPRGFYISVTLFRRGQSREKLRYQYAASSPCIYS